VLGRRRRHALVDGARRLAGDVGVGVVEVLARARADRLHIDAEAVHVRQPLVERVERAPDGGELGAVDLARLGTGEIVDPRRRPRVAGLDDRVGRGNAEVTVDVDDEVPAARCDPDRLAVAARRDGHAASLAGWMVPLHSPKPIGT
jgi:hypothetical protein